MRRFVFLAVASLMGAASVSADPPRPRFESQRGLLAGFPGDSIDLSVMTFTIDGDTVSRDAFFSLDRKSIRTLTVTPAPANLIEVETHAAAMTPLAPDDLPADIVYVINGRVADRVAYTRLKPSEIASVAIVKGAPPRIEVTTVRPRERR